MPCQIPCFQVIPDWSMKTWTRLPRQLTTEVSITELSSGSEKLSIQLSWQSCRPRSLPLGTSCRPPWRCMTRCWTPRDIRVRSRFGIRTVWVEYKTAGIKNMNKEKYFVCHVTFCHFLQQTDSWCNEGRLLWEENKNYYVVRNAGCARSRYTLECSLIFLNQWINELMN